MSSGPIHIEFTSKELFVLRDLAIQQGMTEGNVIRAALRHYQMVTERARRGETIVWQDAMGNVIVEQVGGCMGDDEPLAQRGSPE